MAKTAPKRKAANGYKFAEPLPKGEILQDLSKKQWKLGPSIGKGGFGEIYSAQEVGVGGSKYPYVVKIEPHANGPLFVEMHFYMRNAKHEDVEAFKKERGLKTFGMPLYLGSGSHENKNEKYRFIVMEKFGTDLWKVFLDNNRTFPATTVFKVAIQILDVLEYIHNRGYIHADIKGANILMGTTKETQNKQVYLVDFGLACKYNGDSAFKPDPKKAHDGTIEYLSRDAHQGVPSRRGDLEILAYNIIQWLGCNLPWEKNLKDPKLVQQSKEEYMANVPKFMKACFEKKSPPGPVVDFLNYHSTLKHNSAPDYRNIRKIFLSGLDRGDALGKPLHFSPSKKTPVKRKKDDIASPKQKKGRKKMVVPSDDDGGSADDIDTQTKLEKKVREGTSPKQKNIKRKLVDEQSEDEKENIVGDDDDDSEAETQLTDKEDIDEDPLPKRKRKGEKTMENDENIFHEDVQDVGEPTRRGRARLNHQDYEDEIKPKKKIMKIPAKEATLPKRGKSKVQKQSTSKRKVANAKNFEDLSDQGQKDEPIYHEDINDTEDIKDDEDIKDNEESTSASTRRGRARINYHEDSGEEKKVKRKHIKKSASTKEVHVTGDSMDGYTDAMKEVLLKKMENGKPKDTKKNSQVENEDMVGYTDSMKEIALKNKEKIVSKRSRKANPLPGPSTSSKRTVRSRKCNTVPVSHNDLSDIDQSDSD